MPGQLSLRGPVVLPQQPPEQRRRLAQLDSVPDPLGVLALSEPRHCRDVRPARSLRGVWVGVGQRGWVGDGRREWCRRGDHAPAPGGGPCAAAGEGREVARQGPARAAQPLAPAPPPRPRRRAQRTQPAPQRGGGCHPHGLAPRPGSASRPEPRGTAAAMHPGYRPAEAPAMVGPAQARPWAECQGHLAPVLRHWTENHPKFAAHGPASGCQARPRSPRQAGSVRGFPRSRASAPG